MKIKNNLAIAMISGFLLGSNCSPGLAGDTEEANRLFVTAAKAWSEADALSGSDLSVVETRFLSLNEATRNLNRIVDDHSGADLAVKLMIGENIGPMSMVRVQQARDAARADLSNALAACHDPVVCVSNFALTAARGIDEPSPRAKLLARIAIDRTSSELLEEALQASDLIEGIDNAKWRDRGYRFFAEGQVEEGDYSGGFETAGEIVDWWQRGFFFHSLVEALAEANEFAAAMKVAHPKLDATYSYPRMIADIAVAQVNAGQPDNALLTIGSLENDWDRDKALERMSIAQAEMGLYDEAIQTLDAIGSLSPLVTAITRLAVAQTDASYLAVALEYAGEIEGEDGRETAYRSISKAQAELGKFTEAAETLSGLPETRRSYGFETIAMVQAEVGLFSDAFMMIERIDDQDAIDRVFQQVATKQAEAELFSDAFDTIQQINNSNKSNFSLGKLAGSYAEIGRISEALELAYSINHVEYQRMALKRVVIGQAKAGMLSEAIGAALELSPFSYGLHALLDISDVVAN